MEKASTLHGKRGRSHVDNSQFQEFLRREGITVAEWQQRQTTSNGDVDSQALSLARRRVQKQKR